MYGNPYQQVPAYAQYNPQADFFRQQMAQIAQPQPQQQSPFNQQQTSAYVQPIPTQPQYITRPVTNIEEAKAAMIDPLSTNIFTDFANSKIYVKKINNNGLAEFYSFSLDNSQQASQVDPNVGIYERLDRIESMLKESAVSVSTNAPTNGSTKSAGVAKSAGDATGEKS